MRIIPALFAILIISIFIPLSYANVTGSKPSQQQEGWMQDGKPIPDSDNIKSMNGFGAQLWLINDPSIFESWDKPETPNLPITRTAIRNKPVFLIFLFINPGVDSSIRANVTADVTITSPDGNVYGDFKDIELWQRDYPYPKNTIQLAVGNLGINIEDDEQLGLYKVNAVIKDKNKKVILNLKTDFIAKEK